MHVDWSARIDELMHQIGREYGLDDRQAVEILLAALVSCPRTPNLWLIIETNWYSRDCQDAWFAFGGEWLPCPLPRLRARYPWREAEAEMRAWLDDPGERLFVEPDFERYPSFSRLTLAQFLLQRSLRVRTRTARTADPLRVLDQFSQERRQDALNAAARYVLEDRAALRPANPPRFLAPPDFLYHVELAQRLAPWYPDWEILVKAFALIAVRRAYLHGREETDESDNRAMARVLRDSIPPWIARALVLLLDGQNTSGNIEKHMGLEEKTRRSAYGAHRELVRLHRSGIVYWENLVQRWRLVEDHMRGIRDVLEGRAFGAVASAV